MTPSATICPPSPPVPIPDADLVRKRLAAVTTEADVLRRQLRVSTRHEREQDRIRRLLAESEGCGRG